MKKYLVLLTALLSFAGTHVQMTGTPTAGNCVKWSATGEMIEDAGAACGGSVNWSSLDSVIQKGAINWSSINNITTSNINWSNFNIPTSNVNWTSGAGHGIGKVWTATSTGANWSSIAAGGSQSPWTGDIDGATYDLTGVTALEAKNINADLTVGAEKLNNPGFTGNVNNWTLGTGWAYSSNAIVKSGSDVGTLSQSIANMASGMTNGHEYRLSFDADSVTAGYFSVSIGGRTFPRFNTGSKTFTWDFICTDNTLPLTVTPINGYTSISAVTLDNFSLKEIYDGSTQTGYISTEKDANVTRYLKGANETAFCKVSFGYGNGGDGVFQLLDFAGVMFSQDSDFAILDPGNNFDYKTNMYVVPVTGYYKATIKIRVVDVTTEEPYPGYPNSSYGIGVDVWETYGQWLNDEADTTPVYGDSPSFMWGDSAGSSSGGRNGMVNINYIHATAGQHIGMYGYSDAAQYATDGSMVIELLFAD